MTRRAAVSRRARRAAGASARTTSRRSRKVDGLTLVAVCDIDRGARAARPARSRACPSFASLDEMLAAVPSATSSRSARRRACTPQHGHRRRARREARRHREADGDLARRRPTSWCSACDDAGVQLFVVKQNRLNPPIQLLKRAVDKGRFGRIYMANVTVRWTAAAGVLRRRAVARHVGVRRRRDHEPGVALRRPDAVARRPGRERDGEDGDAGAAHRGRGFRRRACSSSARARSA